MFLLLHGVQGEWQVQEGWDPSADAGRKQMIQKVYKSEMNKNHKEATATTNRQRK